MWSLPDAELWLTGYLRAALAAEGVPVNFVGNYVPKPRKPRMVTVRRDGGASPSLAVDEPRMNVRIWAADTGDVADLAKVVRELMRKAPGNGPCRRYVEQSGPTRLPEESEHASAYMVAEFVLRGSVEEVAES